MEGRFRTKESRLTEGKIRQREQTDGGKVQAKGDRLRESKWKVQAKGAD